MNGLRSIPDVVVKTGVSSESEDVVVQVQGLENEDRGHAVGDTWKWDVYRYWYCGTPASPFTVPEPPGLLDKDKDAEGIFRWGAKYRVAFRRRVFRAGKRRQDKRSVF